MPVESACLPASLPPHLGSFLGVRGCWWITGGIAQGAEAGTSLQEEQQPKVFAAGSTKDGEAAVAACPVGAAVEEAAGQGQFSALLCNGLCLLKPPAREI